VLWKAAKPDEPPDAKWDSAYGPGRPGWHIECSAMCGATLGETFDIHGGGADLQFPHHENEIAQSEAANGKPLARFWVHNGFVRVDNEKMSKSLGNFFTIQEVLARYDPETVRFFLVRAHYRSALNYSDVHLDDARASLRRLYTALQSVPSAAVALDWSHPFAARFKAAMDEDLGTPEAIAVLFELATEVNKTRSAELAGLLKALGACLGLLQGDPEHYLRGRAAEPGQLDDAAVDALVAQRTAAKAARDFATADRLRNDLAAAGIELKDSATGTHWVRAP
jgi:cysteinyl-tRNA synthetase